MDTTGSPAHSRQNTPQIVVGLIILGMGAALLVDRYSDVQHIRSWWPLILILMGVARLTPNHPQPGRRAGIRRSGVWFIMLGLWAFVSDSHLFGFTYATSWPLLLIGAGVLMVWRAVDPGCGRPLRREP
jgi:hypothetical protein